MADDPTTEPKADPPAPPAPANTTFSQADVDRIVADRLAREGKKYADHDELKAKAEKFDALEAANKSEIEKAAERAQAAESKAAAAEARALRLEVATEKGLNPAQAKRLSGATREELEADADEILEAFPTSGAGSPPPPGRRPAAPNTLKGGTDPSTAAPVEMNPAKLAETVPRGY